MIDNIELIDCDDVFRKSVIKQLSGNKLAVIFEIIFFRTFDFERIKLEQGDPVRYKVDVFLETLNLSDAHAQVEVEGLDVLQSPNVPNLYFIRIIGTN